MDAKGTAFSADARRTSMRLHTRGLLGSGVALGLVRAGGLSRDFLLARWVGLGPVLDPYLFAFSILVIALGVIVSIVHVALLPAYTRGTCVLTARRAGHLRLMGGMAVMTGLILARLLPGNLVAAVMLLSVVPATASVVLSARLVSAGRQLAGVLPGVALAVVPVVGALALGYTVGITELVSLILLAYGMEVVVLHALSRRHQVAEGPGLRHALGWSAVAGFGGASLLSTTWLAIDLAVVRGLGETSVSIYSLATRLPQGMSGVIVPAFTNVLMPAASRSVERLEDFGSIWSAVRRAAVSALVVGVLLAAMNLGLSAALGRFAFAGSEVDADHSDEIFATQATLGLMLPGLLAGLVVVRSLQAVGHHRPILVIGIATLIVNAAGDVLFASWFGVKGVALATAVAYSFSGAMLFRTARKIGGVPA